MDHLLLFTRYTMHCFVTSGGKRQAATTLLYYVNHSLGFSLNLLIETQQTLTSLS